MSRLPPRRPARGASGGRPANQASGAWRGPLSLARALSKFGVCSRAEAERWIVDGRVAIDGALVTEPRRRLDPRRNRVDVDGHRVGDDTTRVVVLLNKPPGFITTRVDPGGRATVYDLIRDLPEWVFPVGRLDRDTAGMLVLTNDHQLGQRLTDPVHHVPKTYHALVGGIPSTAAMQALREGIDLGDGVMTRPARVRPLGTGRDGSTWLEIVIAEGRNRQVRRMCTAVGHDVLALSRVRIGRLPLGDLPAGAWRRLEPQDVQRLRG